MSLDTLRQRYPWPASKPTVPPKLEGWFAGQNRTVLEAALTADTRLVVELGSWLGLSASFLARWAPRATIVCIDHWQGSIEHHRHPEWAQLLPTLYETFLANLWDYRARIVPMRTTTLIGMEELRALGLSPEVLYIDASHEAPDVEADVTAALRLFPSAHLVGDDWTWESVRKGVLSAIEKSGTHRELRTHTTCWELPP